MSTSYTKSPCEWPSCNRPSHKLQLSYAAISCIATGDSLAFKDLKNIALILQNSLPESQWVEDLMWFHQSRVRDVELITGLDFYQDSSRPIPELLRVKTRPTAAIHRKT